MAYEVTILPAALRQLANLSRHDRKRIGDKIERLGAEPRQLGAKRLQGTREYLRVRGGDFRVIYTVDDERLKILVLKIAHRREVYRSL